jgi:hypothetical protein
VLSARPQSSRRADGRSAFSATQAQQCPVADADPASEFDLGEISVRHQLLELRSILDRTFGCGND